MLLRQIGLVLIQNLAQTYVDIGGPPEARFFRWRSMLTGNIEKFCRGFYGGLLRAESEVNVKAIRIFLLQDICQNIQKLLYVVPIRRH